MTKHLYASVAVAALLLAAPALADSREMDAFCGQAQLSPLSRITCSHPVLRQMAIDRYSIIKTAEEQLDPDEYQRLWENQRSWLRLVAMWCPVTRDDIPLASNQDCLKHAGMARKRDLIAYANGKEIPEVAVLPSSAAKWIPKAEWPQEALPPGLTLTGQTVPAAPPTDPPKTDNEAAPKRPPLLQNGNLFDADTHAFIGPAPRSKNPPLLQNGNLFDADTHAFIGAAPKLGPLGPLTQAPPPTIAPAPLPKDNLFADIVAPHRVALQRERNGAMLVPVEIAGLRSISFKLDTGASISIVSESIGKEMLAAGVAQDTGGKKRIRLASGQVGVVSIFQINRVTVGGIEFNNVPVAVGDANYSLLLGSDIFNTLKSWRIDNTGPYLEMTK